MGIIVRANGTGRHGCHVGASSYVTRSWGREKLAKQILDGCRAKYCWAVEVAAAAATAEAAATAHLE
jgi:ribosomal protein S6